MKVLIANSHEREAVAELCARSIDLHVVGEAACGRAALDAAGILNPDVMFLDVELPDMSGFEVLRAAAGTTRALGILVSPCADYATRAFEEGAFDYLVTPVAAPRFERTIARARDRLTQAEPGGSYGPFDLGAMVRPVPALPRYLVGERQRKLYPLDPKAVDYIEADGNYVTLRAGKIEYLSRDSIKRLSRELADAGFIRIARSLLVNAASVAYAEVTGHGTFALTLTSGACLHSSPAYRNSILRIIPLPALSKRCGSGAL